MACNPPLADNVHRHCIGGNLLGLTIEALCQEAREFSAAESVHPEPSLFGTTDGKAIGTYLEHKFRAYLTTKGYDYEAGNAANGLDFPGLDVDIKVTSIKQPQSSCPFPPLRSGAGYFQRYASSSTPTTSNRSVL